MERFKMLARPAAGAVALAATVLVAAPATTQAAPVCNTNDGIVDCDFAYIEAAETWVVPDEMLAALVILDGAGGGSFSPYYPGGAGGRAMAVIDAVPGESWEFRLGGGGGEVVSCGGLEVPPAGGYNGGGAGTTFALSELDICESASGGGATDLRIGGSELEHRVLVAGGGGGATNAGGGTDGSTGGGAGGGETGGTGFASTAENNAGSIGGEGGNADGSTGSGQRGQGEDGVVTTVAIGSEIAGGGGGGGWYGGAGGAGAAGGGGGSGYGPAGAALVTGGGSGEGSNGDAGLVYPVPAAPLGAEAIDVAGAVFAQAPASSHASTLQVAYGTAPDALTSLSDPVPATATPTTIPVDGLLPATTYWYRVITTMPNIGVSRSTVGSFTTLAATVADDMNVSTDEDQALEITLDATGPALELDILTSPTHGTAELVGNQVTYTPAPNFNGTDTFTYRATSTETTLSDDGTVTVTVQPVDDPVDATADSYETAFGQPVSGNVLANDVGVDGPMTSALVDPPTGGSVTLDEDGTFVYTPNDGFSGTDTFTYRATDGAPIGLTALAVPGDVATVTITVAAAPSPPTTAPQPPTAPPTTTVVVPQLPATGGSSTGLTLAALLIVLAGGGLALVAATLRRRT